MRKKNYLTNYTMALASWCLFTSLSYQAYSQTGKSIVGIDVTTAISALSKQQLSGVLKNYQIIKVDAKAFHNSVQLNLANTEAKESGLKFQLGSQSFDLNLKPRDFTGKDFKFFVSSDAGIVTFPDIPVETYQGYANGDPSQIAAFSINENEFQGVISNAKGEKFYIEPLKNIASTDASANTSTDLYAFYNVNDVLTGHGQCGYNETVKSQQNIFNRSIADKSNAATGSVGFRVGLFCDKYYYDNRGSDPVQAALAMVNNLNMVEALFYAPISPKGFDFHFKITVVYVSKTSSEITPDNTIDAQIVLDNFKAWANAKTTPFIASDYDIASFWTPRSMTSTQVPNIAGLAYNSGACGVSKYNILHASYNWASPLGYAVDQAHEMGHNLSCAHTAGGPAAPLNTDIMQATIYNSANYWASGSVTSINNFISANSGCIKARTTFAPEPDFKSDIQYGCGGTATVTFSNTTDFIDAATTYVWNFGDGTPTSTQTSPSHVYATQGTFTVTLTATNANGNATVTKANYIWVGGTANASQLAGVARTITSNGAGGAYDVPSNTAWRSMEFKALDDIELVSLKMDAGIAGTRLLYLSTDSGFTYLDKREFDLPLKVLTTVNLNWKLQKGRKYIVYIQEDGLVNGKQYYNQCYRINAGTNNFYGPTAVSAIANVVEFTGNQVSIDYYYNGGPQNTTAWAYWYIGFDWEFKKLCSITPTGINDISKENAFEVNPNPSNGIYTVKFMKEATQQASIEVFNVLGARVYSQKVNNNYISNTEKVDISNLPNGTYFLKVYLGNSQFTKNILKINE